jgi:hypothetical protein
MEGGGRGLLEVLSLYEPAGTEDKHENPRSE